MFLLVNIIGLLAFWELQFYFQEIAKHPMEIYFNSCCIKLVLAWFFVYFQIGRTIVEGLASAIAWVIQSAHTEQDLHSAVSLVVNRWIWRLAHSSQFYL